ncbi:type IV secretion system DNA-binding domain-containing protein [Hansschlegelia sp. KR7-227]|uniref:type IV secretion system DNA-binding domain-containing protein n=1 Tax=Hansschlegelia sp. KR7-227 TaxID=3400914 RepID=UPI003C0DF092
MIASRHERRQTGAASALALLAGLGACAISLVAAQAMSPLTVAQGGAAVTVTAGWFFDGLAAAYQAAARGYPDVAVLNAAFGMLAGVEAVHTMSIKSGLAWSARFHAAAGGLAGFIAFIATYMLAFDSTPVIDTREHIEGPRLIRIASGVKALKSMMKDEAGPAGLGFDLLPGVAMTALRELRGVLILGATGSGKTRILLYLLDQILAATRATPDRRIRLLVHDTTGEILEGFPVSDQAFAVLHGHRPGGWCWAMGRDVLSITDAEATADAFAPSTEGIWGQGASTLLAAAMAKCQADNGKAWGVPEFYDTLLEDPIVLKAAYETIYPPAAALIEVDPESGALSKTTVSFLLTLRAAVLRHLRPLAEHWRDVPASHRFSIVEWLDDSNRCQPRIVILQRSAKYAELSAAWIGAMVDLAAAHANDESFPNSQTRRIFLALEELPTLGKLRSLPGLLDVARNKGIGVIASVQEPEQLTIHYGELQAKSLMKRFRTRIVCQQTLDGDTEELSADVMGTRTVLVDQETRSTDGEGAKTSRTVAKVEKDVPVVSGRHLAYELGVRDGKVRAIVAGFENPVESNWPMTTWPKRRGRDTKPPAQNPENQPVSAA